MTAAEILEARKLLEKATPGPWGVISETASSLYRVASVFIADQRGLPEGQIARANTMDGYGEREANAALIVWMHENLPALLALAEKAQRMEGALQEIAKMVPDTCETTLAHMMGAIAFEALAPLPPAGEAAS